ncbi:MAG: Diadenosine tetraphosphate (Ap4A) hydrolaseHIT [Candidatus Uhrbacteria bacterium GW2011_GWE2_45_35]|uniref:Diadenosine tetraphosphate (Ap4A) hydrolaseHIT n=2 Tax=Candidatus Uhriibacteriota TaxID=1752732 RepID=A0A0G1LLQ6_9BACT|nr:MAG: Diadenosine tetraphosphate (Ap4A) hydrolaseHIT [Candidatus Uhrbacteria bacterium GW2011_GWF2_44_350]KKU05748.1 MAG: Diadenosine tetraphosphate (Ap4A) hydrolaseHIT [Candidatus Uhrbacteria bacterium GW2011_GWE2_45_35]HBR80936.1 diadenosine tetraphosphate hydrolase [Candidatus Uhrbacteria bacterium]HCU31159.1 diadenosine tetraphosphate hydrolase [Candidatus Uhrbacteria bacterium]HCU31703.1 diadenosine tetraphosphate hydrolase [Candidatus Uhrbacteria bacterium]
MYNHAPDDYVCPICLAIRGKETEQTMIKQDDIFYKDNFVVGFIGSKAVKGNEGHPLIVPFGHYENIYDLPEDVAARIIEVVIKTAKALKEVRKADGVNLIQNNEPTAGQHAFHFHLHVFPRFVGDDFEKELWRGKKINPEERVKFAKDLREWFTK